MKKASETCDAVPNPVAIEGFLELEATGVALKRMALEQWRASDEIVCSIQDLMLLFIAKGGEFLARSIAIRSSPGLSEIGRRVPGALVDLAADQGIGPAWGFMKAFVALFERAENHPARAAGWHIAHADLAASFRQSAKLLEGLKQCVVRADEALVPFTLAFPSQASGVLGQDCVKLG